MRNIKLILEYDGTDFCGWQSQPDERTVQDTLQCSLKNLLQETPKLTASGRTDSGVHALGQVVNFKTETDLALDRIQPGLNSYLPRDVRVLQVEEVDDKFNSRFDAKKRVYEFVISKRPTAIGRRFSWFCKYNLDVAKIREASEYLLRKHNFEAFSKFIENERHYLCNITSISWDESDDKIILEIHSNRFLHNMIRIIVGSMVLVGRKKLQPAEVNEILKSKNREKAGAAVPPQGLFLLHVVY